MKFKYLHSLLFAATLLTTTLAGAEWIYGSSFLNGNLGFKEFKEGFWFSIPFLAFLTTHEFGHYFMAKIRKVKVSLPYYIPGWLGIIMSIGTFGAFIRIKQRIDSKRDYFDIGIAGPLAGFVVSVLVLIYGFSHLPGDEFIYKIHPEYKAFAGDYRVLIDKTADPLQAITLGKSMLFSFLEDTFADPALIPHPFEMLHYPIILAGFLGLLFTAINLIPIGQLDGGHILYALVGKKAFDVISPTLLVLLVGYSGLGIFTLDEFSNVYRDAQWKLILQFLLYVYFVYLCFSKILKNPKSNWILALAVVLAQLLISQYIPSFEGYSGLLLFGFLLGRVFGVYHPPTTDTELIGATRIVLGWVAIAIFIICFSPNPIS